jgi:hypothetical protein
MNEPLARELGVILPASGDWNLNYVVTMFSIILGTFFGGKFDANFLQECMEFLRHFLENGKKV